MTAIRLVLLTALLAPAALAPASLAQTWTVQPTPTATDLSNVHARTTTEAYAVGDAGVLLRTTNAGATWNLINLGAGFDLEGVGFNATGSVGLIATDAGPVFRSTDGGVNWTLVATGSGDNLRDVSWASNTVVWTVGREGDGLRSTDAGLTWAVTNIPNVDRLRGIAAISATAAIAVGEVGQIFATTNGGATWTAQNSGTGADLQDVHMLDATTGYVVGSNNTVLKTTNGGATWTNVSSGGAGGDGVFFVDANTGWVVDNAGRIWFTGNGGATWALQPSGTAANLSAVQFASPARGWAVGDGGVVVRFDGPGGLAVTATPVNGPIVIPAGGGSFQYTVTLTNTGTQPLTFQAWTAVTGPAAREPVAGPQALTLPAGGSVTRTLTQQVPGVAPAGTYTYTVKAGTFPGAVLASDGFPFEKAAGLAARGAEAAAGWSASGWDGPVAAAALLEEAALDAVYPNPFARRATVRYALPAAGAVRVAVYDVLGREVAVLVDGPREPGLHEVTLDASALAGGTYLVRLEAGARTQTRRVTLLK